MSNDLDPLYTKDFQRWLKDPECRQVAEHCLGVDALTAERDRYREALEWIAEGRSSVPQSVATAALTQEDQ